MYKRQVIDHVIDDYQPAIDGIDNDLREVAAEVFSSDHHNSAERIFFLKREVLDFQRNAELCRSAAAAMDEAVEQAASIVFPVAPGGRPRIAVAHAEVARRGVGRLATIPLVSAERIVGAVMLEFVPSASGGAGVVASGEHLAFLVAPVLELKRKRGMVGTKESRALPPLTFNTDSEMGTLAHWLGDVEPPASIA